MKYKKPKITFSFTTQTQKKPMKKKMIDPHKLRTAMSAKLAEEVEDGFQTAKEIQGQWELSEARVCALLREGVAAGILEAKKFRIQAGAGLRSVTHYREV
jgi:hypothetical protein